MTGDAYGRMLLDALEGQETVEIVERDDGFIAAGRLGPQLYLAPYRRWPPLHRRAMRFVRGRVLDVGAGGGRVALHLQERGHDVVAIDVSPGAIEVCRRRGVADARELPFERVGPALGRFDTVVMLGNNFGLFASTARARRLLRRLYDLTTDDGRIVAESRDPYSTNDPDHIAYHDRNRARGRMAGQLRIRVRYRRLATPWFDYLIVSRVELDELIAGTGWRVAHELPSDDTYVAVLAKS